MKRSLKIRHLITVPTFFFYKSILHFNEKLCTTLECNKCSNDSYNVLGYIKHYLFYKIIKQMVDGIIKSTFIKKYVSCGDTFCKTPFIK